jgi:sarcosine oxidase delta subunit
MDELQRLEQLRKEAIEHPLKKKRGCKSCKKKADQPIESLPETVIEEPIGPTEADIKLALDLMYGRPNEKDMVFIQWVHKSIFGEDLPIGCGACGATAERRLRHRYNLIRGVKG